MAMNSVDLGQKIHNDMGFTGPVSDQLKGWAQGVIEEVKNGIVNNPTGTITGNTSPGSPLSNGQGSNGIITNIIPSNMSSLVSNYAGYGYITSELTNHCTEIVNHILTFGLVEFSSGNITGQCTSTATSSGPLANGAGNSGKITGLDGNILASAIHSSIYSSQPGPSTKLIQFCSAFTDYIMNNAEVEYSSGSVTGICPAGGGPLGNGTGLNGSIL